MPDKEISHQPVINKTIIINAPPSKVWAALTVPTLMNKWMSETEIEIITDWKVGHPFIVQGDWYKAGFKNTGTLLQFEPEKIFQYSHLSSLSRLPDKAENYTLIGFSLTAIEDQTSLTLTVSNFPTETIYKHFAFYWTVTIELLKKFVEQ